MLELMDAGTKNTAATVLYPNKLACSEPAPDEAIGGLPFAEPGRNEIEFAVPLLVATQLVASKLEAAEFADDIETTLPKCSTV